MLASSWRISENLDEKQALRELIKPVDDGRKPHEDGDGLRVLGQSPSSRMDGVTTKLDYFSEIFTLTFGFASSSFKVSSCHTKVYQFMN